MELESNFVENFTATTKGTGQLTLRNPVFGLRHRPVPALGLNLEWVQPLG